MAREVQGQGGLAGLPRGMGTEATPGDKSGLTLHVAALHSGDRKGKAASGGHGLLEAPQKFRLMA